MIVFRTFSQSYKCLFLQMPRSLSNYANNFIEKKISVQGIDINYVQSGNGSKSVLLMPGALGSAWTDFKPQIELLPKVLQDHTIIAWDPPGYGKSIPPKRQFNLDFFNKDAQYAKSLMDTLGRSKFSVLGWSDGGITGLILSATYPDSVEKLIIWGANSYINEEETKIMEGIRDVKKWSPRMREPMEKIYGEKGFANLWSDWVDGILNIYKKKGGDICKEALQNIKSPTLILHGKKDPMVHPEHIPFLTNGIKGSKYYEFPEGKHNIHLRYPEEFNNVVADFIKS